VDESTNKGSIVNNITTASASTSTSTSTSTSASSTIRKNTLDAPIKVPGFFETVSECDSKVSERLSSFGSMLKDYLPQDVDSVVEKINSIISDCKCTVNVYSV